MPAQKTWLRVSGIQNYHNNVTDFADDNDDIREEQDDPMKGHDNTQNRKRTRANGSKRTIKSILSSYSASDTKIKKKRHKTG